MRAGVDAVDALEMRRLVVHAPDVRARAIAIERRRRRVRRRARARLEEKTLLRVEVERLGGGDAKTIGVETLVRVGVEVRRVTNGHDADLANRRRVVVKVRVVPRQGRLRLRIVPERRQLTPKLERFVHPGRVRRDGRGDRDGGAVSARGRRRRRETRGVHPESDIAFARQTHDVGDVSS